MKKTLIAMLIFLSAVFTIAPSAVEAAKSIELTAAEIVSDIKIGWNLGNQFDPIGDSTYGFSWLGDGTFANTSVNDMETVWSGARVSKANIDTINQAGFNAVRIPVSWVKACDVDYNIRSDWMARVKEVVNYAYDNDMYVIINTHHDDDTFTLTDKNKKNAEKAYIKVWEQIANEFKSYDGRLIFQSFNEPRTKGSPDEWAGGTAEERKNLNDMNQLFVDTVRASGGNNAHRVLMIPTVGASATEAAQRGLIIPADTAADKIIVSIHTYAPWSFTAPPGPYSTRVWSKKKAGDTKPITNLIDLSYDLFVKNGIPVVISEFGAPDKRNTAARAEWAEFLVGYAKSKDIKCFWWDNNNRHSTGDGFALLNRNKNAIVFPEVVEAMMKAAK